MSVTILQSRGYVTRISTRMPFRYGIATMEELPHVFVRLEVKSRGTTSFGFAAEHLPPKWFTKVPDKPFHEEIEEMVGVIRNALKLSVGSRGKDVFELWQQVSEAQSEWCRERRIPALLSNLGTSLVERAVIDAVCRSHNKPFETMLKQGELGLRLGDLHRSLREESLRDGLPERPLSHLTVRHTVGLSDPLTREEIAWNEEVKDGLPQSLDECTATYGLNHFKIKINGDAEEDSRRLNQIAGVLDECAAPDYVFSLDGNERFYSQARFRSYWETLCSTDGLGRFLMRLMFVEQPLHRETALEEEVGRTNQDWLDPPPIIIDESDAEIADLPTALGLGYAGTAHKNCKGVFKSIANRCLLSKWKRECPEGIYLMSGEDLTTVGPVGLQQDLVVQSILGVGSVERNGHHYFPGLSMFPDEMQRKALDGHPDIYRAASSGWPTLKIENGLLDIRSALQAPFGVGFEPCLGKFVPLDRYEPHAA